ncbi:maleylpyruvate isomerase family mycothiol-dependent enzyme [Actinoplanes sp. TBRC 11911]|uniref:maleylpyruvate isomerase N-terminal domain-containing protein n=1 Tax=Actinoplanes sp. TBRC 11911 TaxID=2729386 RepID=UPI00145CE651|nr:maleylpyruvate isomerase N-terminal domain-containing protein [Actinoplanes sp. TBRC 11911]NMO56723.1 maleylpyruvate isomerase family mycothiol-dependent enzyme [Actinoplanes sp. TBRC 11911]
MTMDPLVLLTDVDRATEELLRTAADLDPAAVSAPSLLPGWTIGHVLTHLARSADAYTSMLTWARTGMDTEAEPADLAAGAKRPLREQVEDLRLAHERFADAGAAMTAAAWTLRLPSTGRSAGIIPWERLREVEVHHVDLGDRYTPSDWSEAFALRLLREIATGAGDDWPPMELRPFGIDHPVRIGATENPPVIGGPTKSLAAWLAGRADGADLTVSPDGELPTPARWK